MQCWKMPPVVLRPLGLVHRHGLGQAAWLATCQPDHKVVRPTLRVAVCEMRVSAEMPLPLLLLLLSLLLPQALPTTCCSARWATA
jgi:hypothetical protein